MEEHPLVCYGDQQVIYSFIFEIFTTFSSNILFQNKSILIIIIRKCLANALSNHDIDSFRRALHSPTEVEKFEIETSMTIFEKACQTPHCAQFIEECILAGCDVNKVNLNNFSTTLITFWFSFYSVKLRA